MILALDISTSVVGVTVFGQNKKLHSISYYKFKKGTNLFVKLNEFIEFFKTYTAFPIEEIVIEEPLKKFKGKFSSADTIQKLTQMNAMISGYLYTSLNIEPEYYNVNSARGIVFPTLVIPQKHPNKKYLIWESVMKQEPTINWIYSAKTHKLSDENFDMADSWVVGMAHILTKDKK